MQVTIEMAWENDLPALLSIQNICFEDDYQQYGACPAYGQEPETVAKDLRNRDLYMYALYVDGELAGDAIVKEKGPGEYSLSCLCVSPEHAGKGVGRKAMEFLGRAFDDASRWSLNVPADKERLIRFYEQHGFSITGELDAQGVRLAQMERVTAQG